MSGALAATLAATAYLALQPEIEAPVATAVPPATRQRPAAAARLPAASAPALPARDNARSLGWTALSPAALAAWAAPKPPTPPKPPPPPPAPPTAPIAPVKPPPPAFPYRWIGLLMQDGQATALLDSNRLSLGVREGQVLDQRWRVERIGDERIDLIWLPTGDAVTLDKR